MRRMHFPMCVMLSLIAVAGCKPQAPPNAESDASPAAKQADTDKPPPVTIREVRTDRSAFDPDNNESLTVRFVIDKPSQVALSIFDGRDRLIWRNAPAALQAGDHALVWEGRDTQDQPVPPEAYTYTLSAKTVEGEMVHDLSDVTGGELLNVQDTAWDPKTGMVSYRLDRPARVNIRFGLQGGPYLRTLVDWVPRAAGVQSERWDGWDASHVLSLSGHPLLVTSIKAYSLSDNTVLVGKRPGRVTFANVPKDGARKKQASSDAKRMYFHPDQPLETRGDITTLLTIEGGTTRDDEGRWVVSGKVPVRLNVAAADRERVLERRFEPVFYVDGTYVFETESGYLPLTWQWDTTTVNEGEHFITANVRGYEGNFGAATLKVWVVKPTPVSANTTTDPKGVR